MRRNSSSPAAYRADVGGSQRELLEAVRDVVRDAAPDVTEGIRHGMLDYPGLANLAAQKNYVALYVAPKVLAKHKSKFPGVDAGKSCLRFKRLDQVDAAALRSLLIEVLETRAGGGVSEPGDPTREGRCECGALRYRITGEPVAVAACHCTQCQRQSGSAFSMSLLVPRDGFEWLAGEPRTHRTAADSGADKDCVFCPRCGTRIYNALSSLPGLFNVKPGTLDDTRSLVPAMQVWTKSRQPWVPLLDGCPQFDENPG